jgi:hypothetical protein
VINDRVHLVIRADLEKLGFELIPSAYVSGMIRKSSPASTRTVVILWPFGVGQ